jgi:hypothetical protein
MQKTQKPNPLNFFHLRRLSVPPPHFEYMSIPMRYNILDSVDKWIKEHLKGKFYIGKSIILNKDNQIETVLKIGFENPKELSYFTLACPHLKYY